jgi:hypothetical protein
MDFNALWSRASAAASEVATAAQEQASRAAAAAQEQAELFQGSDTFATVEKALADIAANTVAVAEQSERNFQAMLAEEADKSRARALAESTPKAFGVDEDLEAFLQGLTKETFAAFPLDEEQVPFRDEASSSRLAASEASVVPGTNAPEPETRTRTKSSQGGLVTPWRETHARLALANVPRLRFLRDELVPDAMDDDAFWTVYFAVCAPRLAKAEARAAAAVARSRARRAAAKAERSVSVSRDVAGEETVRDKNVAEKEAFLDDDTARDAETDPAGAAAARAAAFGDEEGSRSDASPSRASGSAREDEDEDPPAGAPAAGDLDAYLNDLLGGSSDEDDKDAEDAAPADDPPPARVSTSEKTHPLPRADE